MQKIGFSCLSSLEVINLCGGELLGYPCDLEIDICDCRVVSLTVRRVGSFFEKKEEYVIPWKNIDCIGSDAILVRIDKCDLDKFICSKERKKEFNFWSKNNCK